MLYPKTNKHKGNLFVRNCICTALIEIMKEKPFKKITITEIIEKSGASRMGFYRNYNSKESVVEDFVSTAFRQTIENIEKQKPLNNKTYNVIAIVLGTFKKYSEQMKLFLDQNLDSLLLKCYKSAYQTLYPSRMDSQSSLGYYYDELLVANLFTIEIAWVRRGMKESPERFARIYSHILQLQSKL